MKAGTLVRHGIFDMHTDHSGPFLLTVNYQIHPADLQFFFVRQKLLIAKSTLPCKKF